VENTFSILVSHFLKPILLSPQTTIQLIKASQIVHNWIRQNNNDSAISVNIDGYESGSIIPRTWPTDFISESIVPLHATQEGNKIEEAYYKCEKLEDYFIGEEAVN